jgi:feruloyl esterase
MKEPLAPAQMEALSTAALAQCDRSDGVADGVIDEPLSCAFDPAELECKGAADGRCLSKLQVEAVRKIYDGGRDAKTKIRLTPGFKAVLGDESQQWSMWIGPPAKNSGASITASQYFAENFWPFMVYNDATVDFRTLDLRRAATDGRSRTGAILNAVDPDLSAVRAAGKKIIQYHGWADGIVPAQYSTWYYEAVEKYLGEDIRDFYRLFMGPGMAHCGGGPGSNAFGLSYHAGRKFDPETHALAALQYWVEEGRVPEKIIATRYRDDDATLGVARTRPLCPYPGVARWTGKGSTDEAKNFVCSLPPKGRNR